VGQRRLWDAVRPHTVDPGALGEYAVLLRRQGPVTAQRALPAVAAHLARSCETCEEDLDELVALMERGQSAGDRSEATPLSPYFHSVDVTRTMDALLGASDSLTRLRAELLRALEQVRALQAATEQQLHGLTAQLLTQPDRLRQMETQAGKCIGSVEELLARLMSEVDEILVRSDRPPGEETLVTREPEAPGPED